MTAEGTNNLRHELRTPINHVIGYAELLLEEEGLNPQLASRLAHVCEVARRVLGATDAAINADPSVARPGAEQLAALVEELEAAAVVLPAAAPAVYLSDIDRIVSASARLRTLAGRLKDANAGLAGVAGPASGSPDSAAPGEGPATLLVVDDDEANRDVLLRRVARLGYRTVEARNGREALDCLASGGVDLVLLDVMMPVMDGFAVLERRRQDAALRDIPVIIISASDHIESAVRCIELGAEDYLQKPFDPVLLKARIGACLEKKRLRDSEKALLATVTAQAAELQAWNRELEARVSQQVLENERLRRLQRFVAPQLAEVIISGGEEQLRSHRREITVLFCDLRGFTPFSETAEPEDVMAVLKELHEAVGPAIFEHRGTLSQFTGDGMMVFFNDPIPCDDPAWEAVQLALEMRARAGRLADGWRKRGHQVELGIGIADGYATCGPIGFEGRFEYTAIGTVTNLAARLCGAAGGGQVLVSDRVYGLVEGRVVAEPVGALELKGMARPVPTYAIHSRKSD